jgi:predicted GH43/DUF377 family glycosyl hydrolase
MQPFAESLGDCHRVYFAGRDTKNRSHIGYFDIKLGKTSRILQVCESALVAPGPAGTFDDSGCNTPWVVNHSGKKYLYYTGWSLGVTVPFYLFVGLAISDDGGQTFDKVSQTPILDRNEIDPYLAASSCVIIDKGIWKMWYVSGTRWEIVNGRARYCSHIKYSTSSDGIHWNRNGRVCIDHRYPAEHIIGRPCVLKKNGIYEMWYSCRGENYRVGYATSNDGLTWQRKDEEAGIGVSEKGWDSEMICYPYVFEHSGTMYMLYNGNGYGKTGIGLATMATDK